MNEQQDRAEKMTQQQQQQAAAFQAQFEALRAELQASLGQLQGRPGGNGDQGATFSRSMRLDVPKFSGVDPERWIFAINEYFSLLNTSIDQRLRNVRFNLEGAVAEWFQWMTRNGLITTWAKFEESVKNHFRPSKYEDPNEALSKLLQLGTVEDYQQEFEKLMNRVMDIPDSLLISFYISGLKLHLQRELLVSKPTTLGDAFSLARTIEARFDDQAAPVAGTSARLEANKVVNDGDDSVASGPVTPTSNSESSGEVKVFNWVRQAIDAESTSDNDAQDQASEIETKMLVEGKQDEAKVVVVADEQNSDEPDVLEGNGVIGNENNKGVDKEVQYYVYTLHVLIPFLKHVNDKYIKKKKMKAAMQRRLWDPGIKFYLGKDQSRVEDKWLWNE
ncbi:retrotransposon-related protein [Tanacetum coccineum]